MSMWRDLQPRHAIRYEAHYGDRVVPCFADRPADLHRMIAATAARARNWFRSPRAMKGLNRSAGSIMAAAGAYLATRS